MQSAVPPSPPLEEVGPLLIEGPTLGVASVLLRASGSSARSSSAATSTALEGSESTTSAGPSLIKLYQFVEGIDDLSSCVLHFVKDDRPGKRCIQDLGVALDEAKTQKVELEAYARRMKEERDEAKAHLVSAHETNGDLNDKWVEARDLLVESNTILEEFRCKIDGLESTLSSSQSLVAKLRASLEAATVEVDSQRKEIEGDYQRISLNLINLYGLDSAQALRENVEEMV